MDYYRIAFIAKPHGVKGGLKLNPLTDSVSRFNGMKRAFLERDGRYEPIEFSSVSVNEDKVILYIEGITTMEQAEALRGAYICVDKDNAVKLPPGRYFVADLIGCEVVDTNDKHYGHITDVLETGANDVYVVDGPIAMLLPALKKVLADVDTEAGRVLIDAQAVEEVAVFED